jgi:hypothetical protein
MLKQSINPSKLPNPRRDKQEFSFLSARNPLIATLSLAILSKTSIVT